MQPSKPSTNWSTKLGLFTGPIMILLGLLAVKFSGKNPTLAYAIVVMGILRTGVSAYLHFRSNKEPEA
jgi:uncharacterized membrane protein